MLNSLHPSHPRLIADDSTWAKIRDRRLADPLLDAFLRRSEAEARAILTAVPVVRRMDGKRLLHVARAALRRILLLSLNYHLTNDPRFARRATEEMLATAAFSDWNPGHFLDIAEMTAALAFGYDWLFDAIAPDLRERIASAIVDKGLKPGLANQGWERSENNWNSVCLSGLALGALALADVQPEIATAILEKTRTFNPNGMKPYAPGGVYPEGAMYWGYGTTFEAILLAALKSALGTDWGLGNSPGFMESADALMRQLGPTGAFFNFSDGLEHPEMESGMWWFAHTLKRPDLLRYEMARMTRYAASKSRPDPNAEADRLLPLAAIWWPDTAEANTSSQAAGHWYGHGPNPVAVFRSPASDPHEMYLALKGGSASLSHGHMDAGSFVFEANGIRWAIDLGMQDYLSLESRGVDLWNGAQGSQRWDVFRLGSLSHNTLTINGERHRVDGHAAITHFSAGNDPGATVDLSAVFEGQAMRVARGFLFREGSHILIRDEVEGMNAGDIVRWALMTRAEITISQDGSQAVLQAGDESVLVSCHAPELARFEAVSAEEPVRDFDAPNPGARLLLLHIATSTPKRIAISVTLQPVLQRDEPRATQDPLGQVPLAEWPLTAARQS